jgi:large subunit ribosomal protein L10
LTRQDKEKEVAWLRDQFQGIRGLILTDYQGMTVAELNDLRSELRKHDVSFKVVKNTLARLACPDTDVALVHEHMVGPRGWAWTDHDENLADMAKVLVDFSKNNKKLELIGGMLAGTKVDAEDLAELAKLPPRDVLLAKALGTMIAPVSSFVNTLAAIPRSFLNVLKAIEQQKEGAAEPSGS